MNCYLPSFNRRIALFYLKEEEEEDEEEEDKQ
jgi:hypothetical protein